MVLSCSDNAYDATEQRQEVASASSIRSYDEALAIAQKAIALVTPSETRGEAAHRRTIDLAKSRKCITVDATRGAGLATSDTLMYVFNFADNEGFAIISANPYADPILAVTESGHYDPDSTTEIGGFEGFIGLAKLYGATIGTEKNEREMSLTSGTSSGSDTLITKTHGTKIPVAWGQHDPEGLFCPNKIAGCANIAIAQIFSYYEYPTEMELFTRTDTIPYIYLDWDALVRHKVGHKYTVYSCYASEATHSAIGRLCREIGYRTESNYSSSTVTTTKPAKVPLLFKEFGFSVVGYDSFSLDDVIKYIDDGYKIFMMGYTAHDDIGHAWVVDRYADVTISTVNASGSSSTWEGNFIHINWGWDGRSNGYFNGKVFNTSEVFASDYGTYAPTTYSFINNLQTLKVKKQ